MMKICVFVVIVWFTRCDLAYSRGTFTVTQRGTGEKSKNTYDVNASFTKRGNNAELFQKALKAYMKYSGASKSPKKDCPGCKKSSTGDDHESNTGSTSMHGGSFMEESGSSYTSHPDSTPAGFEEIRRTVRTRETKTVTTSSDDDNTVDAPVQRRLRKPKNGEKGFYRKYTLTTSNKEE